jgi:hypothetical protein
MFFRFGAALVVVVLISLAGTALEKRNLELRRSVSHQQYRLDVLLQQYAAHRVQAQQLGAPIRTIEQVDAQLALSESSEKPATAAGTGKRKKRAKPQPVATP